jgi:general secretion pathway protein G
MLVVTIIGVLVTLATSMYDGYRNRVNIFRAVTDITAISASIAEFKLDYRHFPVDLAKIGKDTMLDPWGKPYNYVNHSDAKGVGSFRKDKNIVPINSDFDLWSNGKDGASVPPLTAKSSRDDIIRANDGGFVGLASDYDP